MSNVNKLNRMHRRINKLLSVFTNLIDQLENTIMELKDAINTNDEKIEMLKDDNASYSAKIAEYENLKLNVEHIIR